MSAANQDVTVMVARAESRVLAAARALHHAREAYRLAWGQAQASGSEFHRRELAATRDSNKAADAEIYKAIAELAAADEAEAAEIAAHEAEMQQRIADHEVWLDEMEDAAGAHDWYAEYEADLAERARCNRVGSLS